MSNRRTQHRTNIMLRIFYNTARIELCTLLKIHFFLSESGLQQHWPWPSAHNFCLILRSELQTLWDLDWIHLGMSISLDTFDS